MLNELSFQKEGDMKLIHIDSSPMGGRSVSSRAAREFINEYTKIHPEVVTETIDIWQEDIPFFNGVAASGKYKIMKGLPHSEEEKKAWERITREIDRFKSADRYVISSPMWNFSIPFRLKQYIDTVVQPGFTFSFTPDEGYKGLLTGKKAVLFLARGGEYGEGTGGESFDFQKPYLELVLGFMGIEVAGTFLIEPTLSRGEEVALATLEKAVEEAKKIAYSF